MPSSVPVRVDDHPEPIVEIRRLYEIYQLTDLLPAHFVYLREYEAAGNRRGANVEKRRIRQLLLAAMTGLRRSELAALTWADLDLDAGTVRVRATTAKNRREAARSGRR